MPINNFNVGRDVTLNIQGPSGSFVPNLITKFSAKQLTTQINIKGIDGIVRFMELPQGWEGTFDIERADSTVDDYFAQLEANYYNGTNITAITITQTIQETNGGITQYVFQNVSLKLTDAGDWAGDASVKQSIAWVAAKRIKRA